jgi:prepilin-type N-terminal cleavage/methylation domain-containing protein
MNPGEKGFTFVEMAVAAAVVALVALSAGMSVSQIISVSERNTDLTTAVHQVQNVGYWVSQDLLMAQTANATDDTGTADEEFIIAFRKDWETGDTFDIRYIWIDSAYSLKKLRRQQVTRDKDGALTDNKTTLIADNIYTANLSWQSGIWGLSVEARSGGKNVVKEFEINRRRQIQ